MSYSLKNNAYLILGLNTKTTSKEILRRSREVLKILKIGDVPTYDVDIKAFNNIRTEERVRAAQDSLMSPRKHICEFFFWFQIVDGTDKKAFELIKNGDYNRAAKIWENVSENNSKSYNHKKNLALLYNFIMYSENNKDLLVKSLLLWKDLFELDTLWSDFSKIYNLYGEQTSSKVVIADFKNNVQSILSDIYTELHHIHKEADYISEFQKVFSVQSRQIEKTILSPAYLMINDAVEELERMDVSADGILDVNESRKIKRLIKVIQTELNKLIDLGLFDDGRTKAMCDRAANGLRTVVVDIHNNLKERVKARNLLQVAITLSGTTSLKYQLEEDLKIINSGIGHENVRNSGQHQQRNTLKVDFLGVIVPLLQLIMYGIILCIILFIVSYPMYAIGIGILLFVGRYFYVLSSKH